ncbi:competence/damage-inducible protein A [Tengunoibacter tsumagoiensis]|uniref:CinA-like protein n=1 Tax=Tengunoibacter tsumagoiensis TaxID=2014871 RepID=A0A401ZYW9_9CHLR|nr:competence/damage-inducible protein A [Tengunoibacter tsumagoiensis]GCE12040.1 putative competence-damage inducible protein [Tengunoibacter tsumagoiensis]
MRAEIISCGTELLLGHITDTNATYLSQSLATLGIDLYFVSQVGDNQGRIVETLQKAWQRSDLIIMTGGIGPTEDDATRESISALLGEQMQVDPQLEANLRARYTHASRPMPERNVKQATLIPSAQALANPIGSAPGWWVEKDGHIIVAMPGVPREMYRMWEEEVVPKLSAFTGGLIFTRLLRVYGLGEAAVEEELGELIHNTNPTLATYAKNDAVDVRITAKAQTSEEALQLVAEMEERARQILGEHVFGIEGDTLASVIGKALQERGQTLSVMESLTGGQLASTITDFQSSSKHFIGGIVSYSTDVKIQMGVPKETVERYGVISEETARAMATAVRQLLKTDFGIGITGVAGPDKQEEKPVGTVYIAVAGPEGIVTCMGPGWRGGRADNKRHAVLTALNLLRRYLAGTVSPE